MVQWLVVRMHITLAYAILTIWILFYDGSDHRTYIPKRKRWKHRLRKCMVRMRSISGGMHKRLRLRWATLQIRRSTNTGEILAHHATVVAHQARDDTDAHQFHPDWDARQLGIDNPATAFISGHIEDFDGPLLETNKVVRGVGGTRITGAKQGTASFILEDDTGTPHRIALPGSYYIPGTTDRLLSPQHMSQQLLKRRINVHETTDHKQVILQWNQARRTIPLDPRTNVATILTPSPTSPFLAYCATAGLLNDRDPVSYAAAMVSDDDGDDPPTVSASERGEVTRIDAYLPNTKLPPTATVYDDSELTREETAEQQELRKEALLLRYHYNFNHAPFAKLQRMAKQGVIPRALARCRIPACAACLYGKATKRQWRQKGQSNKEEAYQPKQPGEITYVDQLRSPTPGFIAQMTGTLTKQRYKYATIFVDGYSGKGYMYGQRTQSGEETLQAKQTYERMGRQAGVKIQQYHADNGVFKSKQWIEDCQKKGQGLSFAGVDAHFQNGKAEARIRRLTEMTRTILAHARQRWPG